LRSRALCLTIFGTMFQYPAPELLASLEAHELYLLHSIQQYPRLDLFLVEAESRGLLRVDAAVDERQRQEILKTLIIVSKNCMIMTLKQTSDFEISRS
jgi:hypothetical protein